MLNLNGLPEGRVVVVGIGNALRGDDGAGSVVAQRLREAHPELVFDAGQVPENYLGPIRREAPAAVLLVDAADFGGSPGEVRTAMTSEVEGLMLGTHAAPLSMFMRMVEHETGADVRLVAVQAADTRLGAEMSPEVSATVESLVKALTEVVSRS